MKKSSQAGFTVYMVLVILSIATILVSVAVYRVHEVWKASNAEQQKFQARLLAESGIERAEYFLSGGDSHNAYWETDSCKENIGIFGTIRIAAKRIGAFTEIKSIGRHLDFMCTIKSICGREMPEILEPVITLTGHAGGLELTDNTKLSGTVAMFRGRIRYYSYPVIIKESPSLPFDSNAVTETFKKLNEQFLGMLANRNCITTNVKLSDTVKQDTITVLGDLVISAIKISDRHIAVSGKLTVENGAEVKSSILLCERCIIKSSTTDNSLFYSQKKMSIESGFHSSQFICADSICIGKDACFGRMSLCLNHRELCNDTLVSGGVYLEENSKFKGIIISDMDSLAKSREWRPSIVLGKKSDVNGLLITNRSIFMRDNTIKGHIWAQQIESADSNHVAYTNFLSGCTVTPSDVNFPFPLYGPGNVKCVLWNRELLYKKARMHGRMEK